VWLDALPAGARRPRSNEFLFSRGFLNMVRLSAAEVPTGSPGPWIREPVAYAALTGAASETAEALRQALAGRWFDRISGLNLALGQLEGVADRITELVAAAPFAPTLRMLSLTHWHLPDRALRVIAASPHLTNLCSLSLAGEFTAAGWAALVNSPLAGRLEALSLSSWGPVPGEPDRRLIGPDGAAVLAAAPRLENLRTLGLVADRLGADGLRSILTSEHLTGLRKLSMTHDSLDTRDREPFGPARLPELEHLTLIHSGVTASTVRELVASGLLTRLTHLNLNLNDFPGEVVRTLVDEPGGVYRAEIMELGFNPLGDDAVVVIARSDRFPHLSQLSLYRTGLTDTGAAALLNAPWAGQLERLNLIDNGFSDGMRYRLRARFGDTVLLDQSDDPELRRLVSRPGRCS
jgi:hypothetical protein